MIILIKNGCKYLVSQQPVGFNNHNSPCRLQTIKALI